MLTPKALNCLVAFFVIWFVLQAPLRADTEIQTNTIQTGTPSEAPDFLLGQAIHPDLEITTQENPDLRLHFGIRMMGTARYSEPSDADETQPEFDFFLRRARLEAGLDYSENIRFKMDLRNDNSNQEMQGNGSFELGDAALQILDLAEHPWLNLAAYRVKVDVSRTQTVSSAALTYYERAAVTNAASNWVNHNRRATNIQLFGNWDHKIHYSIALGDGVAQESFVDAFEARATRLEGLRVPMYGAKVRLSPIPGWEEYEQSETYFGKGKHASLGVGIFRAPKINFTTPNSQDSFEVDRQLINIEASGHYKQLLLVSELFLLDGAIQDFSTSIPTIGTAEGWYILSEYCFDDFYYLAPFVRFDYHDRFRENNGFTHESISGGVHWYLKGNTIKVGLVYQQDKFGAALNDADNQSISVTSQIHF